MKKLLNILAAVTILSSSSSTLVSCNSKPKKTELSSLQKNMLDSAEFMTKIILSSRHENLNFNVNELLSILLTPNDSAMYLPTAFVEDGVTNNTIANGLNNYESVLAPSITTLDKNNYNGAYASYIMGMYDNSFYNNFLSTGYFNDTINKNGAIGFNQTGGKEKNTSGYAAGLINNLNLETSNEDRERLAWGIQDNGALTNYLLDMGIDGGYPGDVNGTSSPCSAPGAGGTNAAGYLYYNSLMASSYSFFNEDLGANTKGTNSVNNKIKAGSEWKVKDQSALATHTNAIFAWLAGKTTWNNAFLENSSTGDEVAFGQTGAEFTKTAATYNVQGHVAKYASMFNSIDDSTSGITVLSAFINELMPMIAGGTNNAQNIVSKLISDIFTGMWQAEGKGFQTGVLDVLKKLDSSIDWATKYNGVTHKFGAKGSNLITTDNVDADNVKLAGEFLADVIKAYNNQGTAEKKADFAKKVFSAKNNGIIGKAYKDTIVTSAAVSEDEWDSVVLQYNGQGGVNLLTALSNGLINYANHYEEIAQLKDDDKNSWDNKGYYDLSVSQKKQYMADLGYSNGKLTDGSLLSDSLKNLTGTGHNEISELFSAFLDGTNKPMADLWDKEFKYIWSNDYWADNSIKVASSNTTLDGKMEFTLDYTGVGDSTSTASKQYSKVEKSKLDNFNPYQTKIEHQKDSLSDEANQLIDTDRTSGEVLGKNLVNDLKSYDGTGMLENMKKVHYQYDVKWENVSSDTDNPYWVISSIKCYNMDDGGKEFYNIY